MNPARGGQNEEVFSHRRQTPAFDTDQVQKVLDKIDTSNEVGLRDRSCPNERESSGVGVESDQYRNVGFSYFPSLERARLVQIGNGDRIRCLGFHALSPFSAATKTLDKVKLNAG
jgi:hypothetical protein